MQDERCNIQDSRCKIQDVRLLTSVFCLLLSYLFLTASKPLPPIDVAMELIKQPEIPGAAVINVKVTPLIEHSSLDVQIKIPEKLKLTGGAEKWNGVLEMDKTQTFQYNVYIPDNDIYEIKASVTLKLLTGETVKREEILEINPAGKKKAHKKMPVKKGDGRGVIEFKGE